MALAFRRIDIPLGCIITCRCEEAVSRVYRLSEGGDATAMMGGAGTATDVHLQHHGTGGSGSEGASTMTGGTTSGMMGGTF